MAISSSIYTRAIGDVLSLGITLLLQDRVYTASLNTFDDEKKKLTEAEVRKKDRVGPCLQ